MTEIVLNRRRQIDAAVRRSPQLTGTGLLESLFSRLFLGMVYPQIWEDPDADMGALGLRPTDRLVCLASGGCNIMSYLTAAPASVTAVDLSPAHVALVRLKLAAAQSLPDHDRFHAFFGLADQSDNIRAYDRWIAPSLDPESRAWWEAAPLGRRRIAMFSNGFYRYGALGRLIGAVHLLARVGGVDLRRFVASANLEEQRRFFAAEIDPLFRRPHIRFLLRRRASLFGLGIPPAQYDKLAADGDGDVLPVLRERVRKLMCDFPVADNYFAWQACARCYDRTPDGALPPYLKRENFEAVRQNAGRVRVLNRSLTDVLVDAAPASHDVYVLLDAQDWMTDRQLNDLWREIDRTATPGARVIFRTGGAADILPGRVAPAVLDRWTRDADASETAFCADRSAIYGGFHLYRKAA